MKSKSNAQAMETEKIPRLLAQLASTCCCGSNHQPFI